MKTFSSTWTEALAEVLHRGVYAVPRGKPTRELPQYTMIIDMRHPVLRVPERKLSYQFMAAEAYWILSGDDTVAAIAPYNQHISNFSDDGVRFFGAYGPKIKDQLGYVVEKLKSDEHSRQAGLTIWRENPPTTKDVPCTVAAFFNLRDFKLNAHVFMRSSDLWLGAPYDVFNFSMLAHQVCCRLNEDKSKSQTSPGALYLTAASSHLYESNWPEAHAAVSGTLMDQGSTPDELWQSEDVLMTWLKDLRDTKPGHPLRWWEQ